MALSFPIHSAIERLSVLKWLKSAQSLLGQAKKDSGKLAGSALPGFYGFFV